MALIVEDGTVVANANTFVSGSDAATRAELIGATDFSEGDAVDQETALIVAALFMLTRYRKRWKGSITVVTQTLSWPRSNATDELGDKIANNVIPQCVKDAQVELAIQAFRNKSGPLGRIVLEAQGQVTTNDGRQVKRESVKAGPVTVATEYETASTDQPHYVTAARLLEPVLVASVPTVMRL